MPTLPVFDAGPMLSAYAVMLFPDDMSKARGYASFALMKKMDRANAAVIGSDVLTEIMNEAAPFAPHLSEMRERQYAGIAVGAVTKTLLALIDEDPKTASWNSAVSITSEVASRANAKLPTSEASIRSYMQKFAPVLHLWGAWRIRGSRWLADPTVGYSHEDDVGMFLVEAETLLEQLRLWDKGKATQSEYLKADLYRVRPDFRPPARKPGWPVTGVIPRITLDHQKLPDLLPLKRRGRPARHSI